jgi:DNA polymerase I-like protein with 3'-5' exonuclease and polymerase domains
MFQNIIQNTIKSNIFISKDDDLGILTDALKNAVMVSVDTETHGEILLRNGLYGAIRVISLATKDDKNIYKSFVIDVRDMSSGAISSSLNNIDTAYGWNVNFDSEVLEIYGVRINKWFDGMFADGLINAGSSGFEFYHGLAFAANKYLNYDLTGKGTVQLSYDKASDLLPEQISYAAQDAIVTLLASEEIKKTLSDEGLDVPNNLEQSARPFIYKMMKFGIPFDKAGWDSEVLSEHLIGQKEALLELAKLTSNEGESLFGEEALPTWNPDSDKSTRDIFNLFAKEAVASYKKKKYGISNEEIDKLKLTTSDKLDKATLKQIKHPLSTTLIRYREHSKVLSTYGENLTKYLSDDGRIRSQYRQGGIVATGRLSSESPNAQNFAPEMKKYIKPGYVYNEKGEKIPRAFVYADLSQAELRVLAQVSDEENMRKTFILGGDFHARTAGDMFKVDMDELKKSNPKEYSDNRNKAKSVSFGIPYGLGAPALAQNLSDNSGIVTSIDDARKLLKTYTEAYPAVNNWLSERDNRVKELAKDASDIDWHKSLELFKIFNLASPARKLLKRRLKRNPTNAEISKEIIDDQSLINLDDPINLPKFRDEHIEKVRWALSFDNAVLLRHNGKVWSFESRTKTGRRRLFTIPMDSSSTRGFKGKFEGILTHAMLRIATSDNPAVAKIRSEFAELNGLTLPNGVYRHKGMDRNTQWQAKLSERNACIKEFEGAKKHLKFKLLEYFIENYNTTNKADGLVTNGTDNVFKYLLPMALEEQIKSYANRYRNHPIQSLVADIGLEYYSIIDNKLINFDNAFPVQAVHDSIAIECNLSDAQEICDMVKNALETALSHWCPDVVAKADADIRLSLSDEDIIKSEDIKNLLI